MAGLLSYPEIAYRAIAKGDDKEYFQILVVIDAQNVTGQYLVDTSSGIDKQGRPCVNFHFNSDGAAKFSALTGNNLPEQGGQFTRKLGILLDDELDSAPSIQSTISDRGEITGEFTQGRGQGPGRRAQRRQPARRACQGAHRPAAEQRHAGPGHDREERLGDDPGGGPRAAVHALVLPLLRPGGQRGLGPEHDDVAGDHDRRRRALDA